MWAQSCKVKWQFPRYFLGANSNHWLRDGFFANAHSCPLFQQGGPHPCLPPYPHLSIPHCHILAKASGSTHENFPSPLAKPWILHLLSFFTLQMSTRSSHLLLRSLLNHKEEDRWGWRYTSLHSIQKGYSCIKLGALNPNNLKKEMNLCWLGSEPQKSP